MFCRRANAILILQAARIYSDTSGKIPGWRSQSGCAANSAGAQYKYPANMYNEWMLTQWETKGGKFAHALLFTGQCHLDKY